MRQSSYSSTSTSESNIVYFSAGGHNHDGSNSTLIDGSKYSIYDFDQGFIPSNTQRAQTQQKNRNIFVDNVKDILRTAGVELGENVIKSENIIAGSITADLLSTDAIKSRNYVDNSGAVFPDSIIYSNTGTFIDLATGQIQTPNFGLRENGTAYFKGELQAAGGSLASFVINNNGLSTGAVFIGGEIDDPEQAKFNVSGEININNFGEIRITTEDQDGYLAGETHKVTLNGQFFAIDKLYANGDINNNYGLFAGPVGSYSSQPGQYKVVVRSNTNGTYSAILAEERGGVVESAINDPTNLTLRSNYMVARAGEVFTTLYTGELDYEAILTTTTAGGGAIYIGNSSLPASGANGPYYVGEVDIYANGLITSSEIIRFNQTIKPLWGIDVQSSGGGSGIIGIYDSPNGTFRQLYWDNSSSYLRLQENNGLGYKVLTSRDINSGTATNVKSFVINHPLDKDKYLVHAATEGPTSDVFYRGKSKTRNGVAMIELPEYFDALTEDEGVTVHLTPLSDGPVDYILSASAVKDGRFFVYSSNKGLENEFYWRVDAIRKDTNFDVEPVKKDVVLHGHGPYTYLTK
jgi:hypothetical protein